MNNVIIGNDIPSLLMAYHISKNGEKVFLFNSNDCFGGFMYEEAFGSYYLYDNIYIAKIFNEIDLKYHIRSIISMVLYNKELMLLDYGIANFPDLKEKYVKQFYSYLKKNEIETAMNLSNGKLKNIFVFNKYEFLGKIMKYLIDNGVSIINQEIEVINLKRKIIETKLRAYCYKKLLYVDNIKLLSKLLIDNSESKDIIKNNICYINNDMKVIKIKVFYCPDNITWDFVYFVDESSGGVKRLTNNHNKTFTFEIKSSYMESDFLYSTIELLFQKKDNFQIIGTQNIPGNIVPNDFYDNYVIDYFDKREFYLFGRYATLRHKEMMNVTMEDFSERFK